MVAVPNEVIGQYKEIARLCRIQLLAMEAEVFGIIRSLPSRDKEGLLCLIDIGAKSTTCSIVENSALKKSHSFDLAGNDLTFQIAKSFSMDYKAAEEIKRKEGMSKAPQNGRGAREIIIPLVDEVMREVSRITAEFSQTKGKQVQKYILAGGTALMPGLAEYFSDSLGKEVEVPNPFSRVFYPPILEKELKEMGPAYVVAVGMALRGFEF